MARALLHGPRITSPHRAAGRGRPSWLNLLQTGWLGTILLLGTAAVSLYLIQMSAVASGGYELQRFESERDGWRARNEQLELELAKRRSLTWAEAQAVERLGMVRAESPRFLDVPVSSKSAPRSTRGGSRPSDAVSPASATPPDGTADRPLPGNPVLFLDAFRQWTQQVSGQ